MKKIKSILMISGIALLFFCCFCISSFAEDDGIRSFSVRAFSSEEFNNSDSISWWHNATDGKYYFFMPSGSNMSDLQISISGSDRIFCNDAELTEGMVTDIFAEQGEYTVTCADRKYSVVFTVAENLPTICIDTESGSLDEIHKNKNHKESGTALILDQDGKALYDGVLSSIKGRGNSTWKLDKKPYNIKLDKKTDLFGMGKSKKWCLLANRSDYSFIRNQLAYQTAIELGVPYTSETVQLNLYVNGEYQGLYLLTEKVEIDDNRVEIYDLENATEDANEKALDKFPLAGSQKSMNWNTIKYAEIANDPERIDGGFLLELEKIYRYPEEVSGFITKRGQAVVIKEPEYASKAQVQYISRYYQEFEDALYSFDGYNSLGKHYSEYMDIDSLAKMYIMDEFTSNFDNCSSSFYLSKDLDGKLTAGPAWDFDLSLGYTAPNDLINHVPNMGDPSLLYTKTCFIGNHNENNYSLLAQAYSHTDFQMLVHEIWNENHDELYASLQEHISSYSDNIKHSVIMDGIRWNSYQTANFETISEKYFAIVAGVRYFTEHRYAFIKQAFAPDTYYVKYAVGDMGIPLINDNTLYKTGNTAVVCDISSTSTINPYARFAGWNDAPDGTGTMYQPGDEITITDNTVLYAQWTFDNPTEKFMQKIRLIFENIIRLFKLLSDIPKAEA